MNNHENKTPETDNSLAGQYVLGTLSADERAAFESRLAGSIELQKQVNQWQEHFLSITDQLEPVPAPQPLSARIERSLDAMAQSQRASAAPKTERSTSFWSNLSLWRGLSAACLLLAVVLGLQLRTLEPATGGPDFIAVLVAPEDRTPSWVIQASHASQIQLVPLAAIDIPDGKALQFWTKAEGWEAPVSLGLVRKGEPLKVAIDQLPPLIEDQLFEFTVEQASGSPTGKPTGPIQSIGRTVIML
ncbi:anti-sigma factor domain-containing protein [Marinobacter sp. AL4B]|uniref:anti-sigma factor n=1 Tax=Marinobacter sp. AL4B TaxID=2871173 RepID=UPI001CAA577C|nr:anti-sigma factor [Marinobacter sp. AL4B]MBZ0332863.1 anti-sigma factor [Marinobacter sp. AL4B]